MRPQRKTKLVLTGVSLILALSFVAAQQADEPPAVMLERAIQIETVDGDLSAAIDLYERVEAESASSRAVVARALLHLGGCYEKLGKDEARKAYERLVRDYADQPEQVKLARARLAALGKTADANKEPAFTTRKVWTDPILNRFYGAVSPEGRYLTFVDWNTGDMMIRDLQTGINRRLTNKGSREKSAEFAINSKWSPDGKQIAYDWDDGTESCVELRVIASDGGKPRMLLDCEDDRLGWLKTYDWSPDGKQILIFLAQGSRPLTQIMLVSAVDGTTRVLKTLKKDFPHIPNMCFSRDGRYIVYEWPREANSDEHDIFMISVDGGNETALVKHPAQDFLVGWPPESEGILFTSERTGSFDLWFLPVSAGKAQGGPELVKRNIGQIDPIGFTQSGSFYYKQGTGMIDVYVVRMDPQSGKILALPETVVRRFEGRNSGPAYSPDGKYLAYTTSRNRDSVFFRRNPPNVLCILSLETGKEQEFTTEFHTIGGIQWSPNGQFISFGARTNPEGTTGGVYRVNTQNGEITPIDARPRGFDAGARGPFGWKFSPDGNIVIVQGQDKPNEPFRILSRDLLNGEEKQLYTGNRATFSISPDGRWLALKFNEDKQKIVQVMPASGGQPKELLRYEEETDYIGQIEWTADGKYILFQRLHIIKDQPHYALWRIAAEGGEPQELDLVMATFGNLSVHPDGQHLAFGSVGFTRKFPSVWILENFLPPVDGGGK